MILDILAIAAAISGIISTLGIFMQTIKIMHLHESRDVALPMYLIFFINAIIWLSYGIAINNIPIMVSFGIGTIATLSVIMVYFHYKKKGKLKMK